jgi:branched-chain amino acid transport system permease protein
MNTAAGMLRMMAWALLALALIAYPLFADPFWTVQIGAQALFMGIIALSLVFLAGLGGMVSLAQLTVAGASGYALAYLGTSDPNLGASLAWYLAIPAALVIGTLFGGMVGLVSVRTSGIYTIMITLAIAVSFFYLVRQNYFVFNGFDGFKQITPPTIAGVGLRDPNAYYYLCLALAALTLAVVAYIRRAPFGLALQAMRDNPRRLAALGYRVWQHRVAAHLVAGLIGAVGGVLLVWYNGQISPGTVGVMPTVNVLIMAVIGGLGHPIGAFLGALVFTLVDNFASDFIDRERFNTLIGATFVAIVMFSPDGLYGLARRLRRGGAAMLQPRRQSRHGGADRVPRPHADEPRS